MSKASINHYKTKIRQLRDANQTLNREKKELQTEISKLSAENQEIKKLNSSFRRNEEKRKQQEASNTQKENKKKRKDRIANWIYYLFEIGVYSYLTYIIILGDIGNACVVAMLLSLAMVIFDMIIRWESYSLVESYLHLAADYLQTFLPLIIASCLLLINSKSDGLNSILYNLPMVLILATLIFLMLVMFLLSFVASLITKIIIKRKNTSNIKTNS